VHDVIVVGGGHNGLTCAAYLARAGRRVLVVESRDIVGGYCTTEETVAEAPGYKMNPCALDCLMTSVPRSIIDDLQLARYGLRFVEPEPWGSYIGPDGENIAMWRDRARTVAEIARFSRGDAERFERLMQIMKDFWWAAAPYLQDHPTRPRARTLAEVAWRAFQGRRSLRPLARVLMAAPETLLEEWFDREEIKAFLANLAVVSYLPLQEPGSGAVLGASALYIEWGAFRPVGGSGVFTGAIADCVRAHGGEIRTGAPVEEILVRSDGTTEGVRLVSGEQLRARQVVGAVDPYTLVSGMVSATYVPEQTRRELKGLGVYRWNISQFKSDLALDRRPPLACGRQELWNGFLLLGSTMEIMRKAQYASINGEIPPGEVPMWVALPSVADRTQVPPGSDGETAYLYCCTVPLELRDGQTWPDVQDDFHEKCVTDVDRYAPGFRGAVIGANVKTPADYARRTHKGHVIHADVSLHHMGPWRPTPSLAGYRTPVTGLWSAGAGTHPIGLLNGWSGRTVARLVDKALSANPTARPHRGLQGRTWTSSPSPPPSSSSRGEASRRSFHRSPAPST
jgi:beta-carotene ketolase (CrtO type)